jgi:hypothetical protein
MQTFSSIDVEEVIGSIPIRSTDHFNNSDKEAALLRSARLCVCG